MPLDLAMMGTIQLAMSLASQGMRAWADFTDRAARGEVTDAELDTMAAAMGVNIEGLRADIATARAAGG